MECCLTIFQSADFRGQNEIKRCWEQLITNVHAAAIAEDKVQPFEMVADTIRRLGQRFVNCEHIFPPGIVTHNACGGSRCPFTNSV